MEKKQYPGLDVTKAVLAVLVAARHVIQIFYPAESKWRMVIGCWLSNLAVPGFFIMAGFFLFRKTEGKDPKEQGEIVLRYCLRILKLTVIWSVLYLPIEVMNWHNSGTAVWPWIGNYLKRFFTSHSIVQLWFLPALMTACLLVWFCRRKGLKIPQILVISGALFVAGCICDNWYFNRYLPAFARALLELYEKYFITVRNGVFYGFFFTALGLHFAKQTFVCPAGGCTTTQESPAGAFVIPECMLPDRRRTSKEKTPVAFWSLAAGFLVSVTLMFLEVRQCQNANMVLTSAPAAYFLIAAAMTARWKERKLYLRLRSLSQWIYLSHEYFIHLFSLTVPWNPLPLTKKGIMISVFVPMMAFCTAMVLLSEKQRFSWLKKLI